MKINGQVLGNSQDLAAISGKTELYALMTAFVCKIFYSFCPIGYVQQEDIFIGTLKVKEHLKFQAMLRMGRSFTTEEKNNRVEQVLNDVSILF